MLSHSNCGGPPSSDIASGSAQPTESTALAAIAAPAIHPRPMRVIASPPERLSPTAWQRACQQLGPPLSGSPRAGVGCRRSRHLLRAAARARAARRALRHARAVKLAWLTDIHLDFLSPEAIAALGAKVVRSGADAALLTGDISVARALAAHLAALVRGWEVPCYFVAGNHDYYGASIDVVRRGLRELRGLDARLRWLPNEGVVRLTEKTALVGVDGWADGRLGDGAGTQVVLNDHLRIVDLLQPSRAKLLETVRAIGDAEAATLRRLLGEALAPCEHVIVATHVPPFRESSTHLGRVSGDDWLPWMTCHATGEVLRELALAHPERRITVLAGHTHDRCRVAIEPNLEVRVGAAEYGHPTIEDVLTIE
jgi:predicted phosphohydrolase